jgi:hypothetical protein
LRGGILPEFAGTVLRPAGLADEKPLGSLIFLAHGTIFAHSSDRSAGFVLPRHGQALIIFSKVFS